MGIKPFDLVERMAGMLDRAPAGFRDVIAGFVRESQEELFPNRAACLVWAREHLDGLISGEIGGNLLSKYSMLGRFCATHDALDFLRDVLFDALGGDSDAIKREQAVAVTEFLRCVLLHCPFAETLETAPVWESRFDVEAWSEDKYGQPLTAYRYSEPRMFGTLVEPEKKALIENRIRTFGEHPSGLGKFTRTMFARQLRRTMFASVPEPPQNSYASPRTEEVI
jgi:hypothetical protein